VWSRAFKSVSGSWLPGNILARRTSLTSLDAQFLRYWFRWEGLDAEVMVVIMEANETSLAD
jgi:hypothetical protein